MTNPLQAVILSAAKDLQGIMGWYEKGRPAGGPSPAAFAQCLTSGPEKAVNSASAILRNLSSS
jgi:hypothetical protein